MKLNILLLFFQAGCLLAQSTLPTACPTVATQDPWDCFSRNVTSLIRFPTPTGDLRSALFSYGSQLASSCINKTPTGSIKTLSKCTYPAKSLWCNFTLAAPTSVLTAYQQYARSNRLLFYSTRSSSISAAAKTCPYAYWNAVVDQPWITQALYHADCDKTAYPSISVSTTKSSSTSSTKTTSTSSSKASSTTSTKASSGSTSSSTSRSSSGSTTSPRQPMRT